MKQSLPSHSSPVAHMGCLPPHINLRTPSPRDHTSRPGFYSEPSSHPYLHIRTYSVSIRPDSCSPPLTRQATVLIRVVPCRPSRAKALRADESGGITMKYLSHPASSGLHCVSQLSSNANSQPNRCQFIPWFCLERHQIVSRFVSRFVM